MGDRDVFVDFERRVSRIQGWFAGYFEKIDTTANPLGEAGSGGSGLNIDPGLASDASTIPEYLPRQDSFAAYGSDFQWTHDFFSPGNIDQTLGDWM
jgi:hypothetical protein